MKKQKKSLTGSIRFKVPPAGYRHTDRKKQANKKACRGKVMV